MVNLREKAEADLATTLEKEWGLPVQLVDPDGNEITQSFNDATLLLRGQVLYDTVRVDPETGEPMIINEPIVTLRRSSLERVPIAGENWLVRIPVDPSESAAFIDFVISPTKAPEGGRSIGFIRLYLRRAVQS